MKKTEKEKALSELWSFLDIADEFQNDGNDEKAKLIREKVAKIETLISKLN